AERHGGPERHGGRSLQGDGLARFGAAVTDVCAELARAIAADAEGATKLVVIEVEGLRDDEEARTVARAVANSALVQTALFGADPTCPGAPAPAGVPGRGSRAKASAARQRSAFSPTTPAGLPGR